jgi:hypothetical protein
MLKCHCRDCQQASGGPYVPVVVFPFASFRITQGTLKHHTAESAVGGHNLRGFCSECGSRITGAESEEKGIIGVAASSLDDPSRFQPRFAMFVDDAQPWDQLTEGMKKYSVHFRRG